MNYLITLMALIGQPVALETDMGTCTGHVVSPSQVIIQDGTCALDDESALVTKDGKAVGWFTRSVRLESGRVLAYFVGMP